MAPMARDCRTEPPLHDCVAALRRLLAPCFVVPGGGIRQAPDDQHLKRDEPLKKGETLASFALVRATAEGAVRLSGAGVARP